LSRRLTAKDRTALIEAYIAGTPSIELMERFDLGKGSVLSVLHEAKVPMRGQGLPADRLDQARTLYQSGLSLRAVGAEVGCDAETVRKALKAAGIRIRPRNGWLSP
jgi:DNA-directed RNA polymerase specialized sigma24 family protein